MFSACKVKRESKLSICETNQLFYDSKLQQSLMSHPEIGGHASVSESKVVSEIEGLKS